MDRIPDKIDSKFRYVLVSAQRAEQMMRGARPKIDHQGRKLTIVAMDEISKDMVAWDYGPAPEPEIDESEEDDENEVN